MTHQVFTLPKQTQIDSSVMPCCSSTDHSGNPPSISPCPSSSYTFYDYEGFRIDGKNASDIVRSYRNKSFLPCTRGLVGNELRGKPRNACYESALFLSPIDNLMARNSRRYQNDQFPSLLAALPCLPENSERRISSACRQRFREHHTISSLVTLDCGNDQSLRASTCKSPGYEDFCMAFSR